MSPRAERPQLAGGLLRLTADCSLKLIEEPAVYNRASDELYFINEEAVPFLAACAAGAPAPEGDDAAGLVDFCLDEGILEPVGKAAPRRLDLRQSPLPSLRYLLLHITDRCNLACAHCFQGEPGTPVNELDLAAITAVLDEFEAMQGLRLMVSGGEPLLHPGFRELNEDMAGRDIRSILLSNGMRIDAPTAAALNFNEVQVSIDGIGPAHDRLRGPGSFDRAVTAARALGEAGKQLSIATMIHAGNLGDFGELEELVHGLGAREWSIDLPSPAGRLAGDSGLLVDPRQAGPLLNLAFGGAIHEPAAGYACGAHLMAVMADGAIARCGFYGDTPAGFVADGLAGAWERIKRVPLSALECDCEHLAECRGGCRFRAAGHGGEYAADPCQCYRYGVR
ncbi:MAG: radical SAM protein [Thermoleophilia bacterium]